MSISFEKDGFRVALAESEDDLRMAQALRYEVFVQELGGQGAGVDHAQRTEQDRFDAVADHLLLRDLETDEALGVYRLMRSDQAGGRNGLGPGFYSESEFDLTALKTSGRQLLELGRSCVRADHRGGAAMFHLWTGLARYVAAHGSELLFGVASFKGTDLDQIAGPLSLLHHQHLAPQDLRVTARSSHSMDLISKNNLDRRSAMVQMPPLIKSYLRLGGMVGEGAFVDHAFNCTDVCMIMDTAAMNARSTRFYQQAASQ